jgi:CBS domain-containing protein
MAYFARDIMNPNVISVPAAMDLRDLAKLLLKEGITGAPVVDGNGHLVGVISQTDLVYYHLTRGDELVFDSAFYHSAKVEGRHVPAGFQFEDFNSGCVADVMTPVVHSVTESASLASVARLMTREHIHRVIVRKGRSVVGIISALDLLRVDGVPSGAAKKKKTTRHAPASPR